MIESLENQVLLEELWLGKNRIKEITNLSDFKYLKKLSLQVTNINYLFKSSVGQYFQNNYITAISGLSCLCSLEELYLSFNQIRKISGLISCVRF